MVAVRLEMLTGEVDVTCTTTQSAAHRYTSYVCVKLDVIICIGYNTAWSALCECSEHNTRQTVFYCTYFMTTHQMAIDTQAVTRETKLILSNRTKPQK